MSKIKIGTAAWHREQILYPRGCNSTRAKLAYYSSMFPMVEVDSTHYAIHEPDVVRVWADSTPSDFVFHVKAFQLLTWHGTRLENLPQDIRQRLPDGRQLVHYRDVPPHVRDLVWARFEEMLEPLDEAGKLGVVLLQFPYDFEPGEPSRDHLLECRDQLYRHRIAVELRNRDWFDGREGSSTMDFLERNDLGYAGVDGPQGLETSVPPMAPPYGDIRFLRFHGRNREGWESGVMGRRTNYEYSPEEFMEWVPAIRELARHSDEVHLVMNTVQGVRNGHLLAELLDEGLQDRQRPLDGPEHQLGLEGMFAA